MNLKSSENAKVSGTFTDEFLSNLLAYKKLAACALLSELSTRTYELLSVRTRKYFLLLASSLSDSKLKVVVPTTLLNQSVISIRFFFNSL